MTAVVVAGPDRVLEAASVRRRELAATRRRLAGGHRADLRTALGLARLSCSAGLTADLDDLGRRAALRVGTAGRAERAQFGSWLAGELAQVRCRSEARYASTAGPAVRRVAAGLCPGAAPMPLPDGPAGTGPRVMALPVAAERGLPVDPRLLAGLAGLPVLGVGGIGGATALIVAGLLLVLGALAHTRSTASARARLLEGAARVIAATGLDAERALARRSIETEHAVGAALERALADRRGRLEPGQEEVADALG